MFPEMLMSFNITSETTKNFLVSSVYLECDLFVCGPPCEIFNICAILAVFLQCGSRINASHYTECFRQLVRKNFIYLFPIYVDFLKFGILKSNHFIQNISSFE